LGQPIRFTVGTVNREFLHPLDTLELAKTTKWNSRSTLMSSVS
jgi:hypothetical protein